MEGTIMELTYNLKVKKKGKVVLVLKELIAVSWKHMRDWRYNSAVLDLGTR
jgi:hypothetical protein